MKQLALSKAVCSNLTIKEEHYYKNNKKAIVATDWASKELPEINNYYNIGENIIDKSTEISNIGFSVECFTADFFQFSVAQLSKFPIWVERLGICHQFQASQGFL